jgi:YVTN family beta-propeller protein
MKCSLTLLTFVALVTLPLAAQSGRPFIVQTNSAGDSVHLIDPATDRIVAEIPESEVVHGAAAAPDGSRLYLSNESTSTLDIVDTRTLRITKKIPLTGHPNNLSIHKNGRRVYVAIQQPDGGVDVIDTVKEERVKTIRVLRGVHNTFITPDSKYVVAGSTGGSVATVIDTETEQAVWSIHFEGGVRPLCFETNPDG